MYGSVVSLILDVTLNLVLMRTYGVSGIALSTSLVYVVAFCFLGICTARVLSERLKMAIAVAGTAAASSPSSRYAFEVTNRDL
jgi:Na+-driven multidrug efflux pump